MDIIRPDIVQAREKAEQEAKQQERRRIALALLPSIIAGDNSFDASLDVSIALEYADKLIERTTAK